MSVDTGAISRTLSRGRWRLLIRAMGARAGAVVGLCASAIALDQLGAASRPMLLALCATVGLAWVTRELRRLRVPAVAARLDREGRSHDTLRTAVWLMSRSASSPWVDHQLDRAAGLADELPPLPLPARRLAIVAVALLALGSSFSIAPSGRLGARVAELREQLTALEPVDDPEAGEREPSAAQEDEAGVMDEIETLTVEQAAEMGSTARDTLTDGLAGNVRASAEGQEPTEVAASDDLGERLQPPGADQAADESAVEGAPGQMLAATQKEAADEAADEAGMSLPGEEFRWADAALAEKPPAEEGAQATSGDTSGAGEGGDPQLGEPTQLAVERELERLDAQEPSDDEEAEEIERASRAGPSRRSFRATALAGASEPPNPIRRALISWEDRRRIERFFERETNERER